jgi:hypothetical protein
MAARRTLQLISSGSANEFCLSFSSICILCGFAFLVRETRRAPVRAPGPRFQTANGRWPSSPSCSAQNPRDRAERRDRHHFSMALASVWSKDRRHGLPCSAKATRTLCPAGRDRAGLPGHGLISVLAAGPRRPLLVYQTGGTGARTRVGMKTVRIYPVANRIVFYV